MTEQAPDNAADSVLATAPVDVEAIDRASPIAAVRALIDEAKVSLDTEIALAKTIGRVAGQSLQRMALWGTIALLFAFVGLLALAVGLTIALADVIGPTAAALVVGGGLISIGLFGGWRARTNLILLQKAAELVVE